MQKLTLLLTLCTAVIALADHALTTPNGRFLFSKESGAILSVTGSGSAASIWQSGSQGLWSARFSDNTTIEASQFHATNTLLNFSCQATADGQRLDLHYKSDLLNLCVTATRLSDGIELNCEATPHAKTLTQIDLPGRMHFALPGIKRFIMPQNGNTGPGVAFNQKFFAPQPDSPAAGWNFTTTGPQGYKSLYNNGLVQREVYVEPSQLVVTAEGREWLPESVAERVNRLHATVNRAPTAAQAEITVVNSPHGPYFSANRLGGTQGGLWRIGGAVSQQEVGLVQDLIASVSEKLIRTATASRNKLALINLENGPERGNWCDITIEEWRKRMDSLTGVKQGSLSLVELSTPQAVWEALHASDFIAILNPYGEAIPIRTTLSEMLEALRGYVKSGGHWFETGGYSFYQTLTPLRHLAYHDSYPVLFADFMHLDSDNGAISLYRIQPRTVKEPWEAAQKHTEIFVPGALGCGSDAQGGYCSHAFNTWVEAGASWRTPAMRMTINTPVAIALAKYTQENRLTRNLTEKIAPEKLDLLKRSILLYLGGTCREKSAVLPLLPSPMLLHFADYLKGGFDKEYPDHLPPNPSFGTPTELRSLFSQARALGHLISPYTNPTWWCDQPQGPTFERAGNAPLLKGLDGKPRHERYSSNVGWTITLWHPDVQKANRATVEQFTRDYPVDILFQDQCGARTWHYDTNPASPTPYAYSEGMIAMNDEDSRVVPIGTENAWDRVANYQTLICGMTWGLVPTKHQPEWVRLFKSRYPAESWETFPIALMMMHDKAIFMHHDLGQFVTDDRVLSWTLALGYSLSQRLATSALKHEEQREWLLWLDRLQKSLCARYVGEPLLHFKHDRSPLFATQGDYRRRSDDGVITATYGAVRLTCNLGDVPRTINDTPLPAYGFSAQAPGLQAGTTPEGIGYIIEQVNQRYDIWLFGTPGTAATLPSPVKGNCILCFEQNTPMQLNIDGANLKIPSLPSHNSGTRRLYHALLQSATLPH